MISVEEALKLIQQQIHSFPEECIDLNTALGRFLSRDITSSIAVPSFDNSAMDGYAIAFEPDRTNYSVAFEMAAGETQLKHLNKGEAARIYTGAPIPFGADTVVQQEWVSNSELGISFDSNKVKLGMHIRRKGEQTQPGSTVCSSGTEITPSLISLLSSIGCTKIWVHSLPKITLIITGNELVEPGNELNFGQIFNSNGPALKALLAKINITKTRTFTAPDQANALSEIIAESLENCDILLLTGGVSVGDYDFVNDCLSQNGVQKIFHKIAQKPGKPLWFGTTQSRQWVFGLPGNPAAVITCFNQYVKPAILIGMGKSDAFLSLGKLPLAHDFHKKSDLTFFMKGYYNLKEVELLPAQESFNLSSFKIANCIVKIDAHKTTLSAGEMVEIYPL